MPGRTSRAPRFRYDGMKTTGTGSIIPDNHYGLKTPEGRNFSLNGIAQNPLSLLIVYKQSCPTCSFLLHHLREWIMRLGSDIPALLLVSQDSAAETAAFWEHLKMPLPVAVDSPNFTLSGELDFQTVPATFLVNKAGKILKKSEGFLRDEFIDITEQWLASNQFADIPVFGKPEKIPVLKPG